MEMKFDNVDAGRPFDWGRTSEDYARYRGNLRKEN